MTDTLDVMSQDLALLTDQTSLGSELLRFLNLYENQATPQDLSIIFALDKSVVADFINKYLELKKHFDTCKNKTGTELVTVVSVDTDNILEQKNAMATYKILDSLHDQIQGLKNILDDLNIRDDAGDVNAKGLNIYVDAWEKLQRALQWVIEKRIQFNSLRMDEIYREEILKVIKETDFSTATKIREAIVQKRKELGLDL